jgi:hypothetical protein
MFHNQHESRGVHLSDYIESESDSGMKRFSLQDGQMSNCMLSARFLWYKAIIIKPFLFFPEKSVRTKHFSNFVFEEVFTLIN